jgi:endonuclease/exonuclease/phosphatase family metal-dependent hydrolase
VPQASSIHLIVIFMTNSELSILTFNVDDKLSKPSGLESARAMMEDLNPDVMVLTEACPSDDKGILTKTLDVIERNGYAISYVDEEIKPERPDIHGLLVAAKYELEPRLKAVPLVGRMAIKGEMVIPQAGIAMQFFGQHSSDMTEEDRSKDILALIEDATDYTGGLLSPTVVAGDFNTFRRHGLKPLILRSVGRVANMFEATPPHVLTGWRRKVSVVQRVGEMAHGNALEQLHLAGLQDTAPNRASTFYDSVTFGPISKQFGLQLDHVVASSEFTVTHHEIIKNRPWLYDSAGDRLSPHFPVYVELVPTTL